MSNNKLQIQVQQNAPQFDVSGFPKGIERSIDGNGALFFRKNSVMTLTTAEFTHVKKERPDMIKHLTILDAKKLTKEQLALRVGAPKRAKAKAEAEAKVEAEAKAKTEAKAEETSEEPTQSKSSGAQNTPQNSRRTRR